MADFLAFNSRFGLTYVDYALLAILIFAEIMLILIAFKKSGTMMYSCPNCNWTLIQPQPGNYPDTERGQDDYNADLSSFVYEQESHKCPGQLPVDRKGF